MGNPALSWETVREIRRLYLGGVESRELDRRFRLNTCDIVRNRSWKDPSYEPPPGRRGGRKAAPLTILGESKSPRDWAADPRCQVALDTLRKRVAEGHPHETILLKRSNAGRPRG